MEGHEGDEGLVFGSDALRVERNRSLEDDAAHGQRHVQHVVHDEGVEAECEAVHLPFDNLQRAVPRLQCAVVRSILLAVRAPLESCQSIAERADRLAESRCSSAASQSAVAVRAQP